jgi:probable phosphoglycerate mutase
VPDRLHVLLCRHGQTDSNAAGILQGHRPTPLNARGHQQARRLAERLAVMRPRIDHLVSSDLRRAIETAEPVARALGHELRQAPAWRERGFGDFEGRTLDEAALWRAASGEFDPPGAEPVAAFQARVADALRALVDRYPDGACVGVITHGGAIRTVLRLLHDGRLRLAGGAVPPELVPIVNASILHLTAERDEAGAATWRPVVVNDVAHLEGLVTDRDAG